MPRYFFHVHGSQEALDEDGTVLPDDDAARLAAVHACGEAVRDLDRSFLESPEWRMIVAGEDGRVIFTLRLSADGV